MTELQRRERRPVVSETASPESSAGGPVPMMPHRGVEEVALDLAACSPEVRAAFMVGYESGWMGAESRQWADYAQAIEDLARHYVRMIRLNEEIERSVADTIRRGPFDAAADRRGQHERAAAARRLYRERGLSV